MLATVNGVDLAVLKALGDETRYAMYRELATSTPKVRFGRMSFKL